MEINRNFLFKMDNILIFLEFGLGGKWEVYSKNFFFIFKKINFLFCFNIKLVRKCYFLSRNLIDYDF